MGDGRGQFAWAAPVSARGGLRVREPRVRVSRARCMTAGGMTVGLGVESQHVGGQAAFSAWWPFGTGRRRFESVLGYKFLARG